MDYEELTKIRKKGKFYISDLLALSPTNDPFYCGIKRSKDLANWFMGFFNEFGCGQGIHIRRIHYRLLSQKKQVHFPNGKPYLNTLECSGILDAASKYARNLYLVDPWLFDDRRNPKPIVNIARLDDPFIDIMGNFWDDEFTFPEMPELPQYYIENYVADQKYHIEIWCEKSTMNDILIPFCERRGINLLTAVGEFSLTHVTWLIDRLREIRKPCRVVYLSDFDPGGRSMPVAVARKIEKLLYDEEKKYGTLFDVKLKHIFLTHEQCKDYELPRTPIKDGEKRAEAFEERFGTGATELDALEALYPGELLRIMNKEVEPYYDRHLNTKVSEVKMDLRDDLEEITDNIIDKHRKDIDEIWITYKELKKNFQDEMAELRERIQHKWTEIDNDLRAQCPDINEYPKPEGQDVIELFPPLYDSDRNYMEQLHMYRKFQGKPKKLPIKAGKRGG